MNDLFVRMKKWAVFIAGQDPESGLGELIEEAATEIARLSVAIGDIANWHGGDPIDPDAEKIRQFAKETVGVFPYDARLDAVERIKRMRDGGSPF